MWKISVLTTPLAEEAVSDLLSSVFGAPACGYTSAKTGATTVSVYLKAKSPLRKLGHVLREGLRLIRTRGIELGSGRISQRWIPRQNWAESWKRHFKPFQIGDALLIKPGWSKQRPRPGQALVVLDPGMSFGTGQHPTTWFCLRALAKFRSPGRAQSFLDIGAGSGILAIAAAKLGYAPVHGFDSDPQAVRVARSNARANNVHRRIRVFQGDLAALPPRPDRQYAVVCANLLSTTLLAERDRILARLEDGGKLVLAGILKTEFHEVRRAYESAGLRCLAGRTEREWRSLAFTRVP